MGHAVHGARFTCTTGRARNAATEVGGVPRIDGSVVDASVSRRSTSEERRVRSAPVDSERRETRRARRSNTEEVAPEGSDDVSRSSTRMSCS